MNGSTADQELLAFSAANAAAGVTQGMPVGTAGSRTGVNLSMGATSQVSGLVAAGFILVVLVLLTEPIQYLPAATLAAIIVTGAVRLIDPNQWRALGRSDRAELVIAVVTAVAVINLGVLVALVVAVGLSLLDVIRRIARPNDAVLGWSPTEVRYADVSSDPDVEVTPGVVVYRFSDRLFFANVHFFKRRVWAAVDAAPKPTRHFVLDMAGVPGLDSSAAAGLRELHDGLLARNVSLEIARATDPLEAAMDRLGLVELIGTGSLPRNGDLRGGVGRWVSERGDPEVLDRPLPGPLRRDDLVVAVRLGVVRCVQLVQGLHDEAVGSQDADPVAVRGMELDASLRPPHASYVGLRPLQLLTGVAALPRARTATPARCWSGRRGARRAAAAELPPRSTARGRTRRSLRTRSPPGRRSRPAEVRRRHWPRRAGTSARSAPGSAERSRAGPV